ncbi:MAG: fumarylacetoacetate hydrolase family protein [Gammaproteobacteria bacterium]|jgi:2-keto-4-pentenoate hydratase/2-oxohepta-3-ene-1,7-dioic acid hydratase in catechol pathway
MQLVTFIESQAEPKTPRTGLLVRSSAEVVDFARLATDLPKNMLDLIALGDSALPAMNRAIRSGSARLPLSEVELLAPIPQPVRNILCVGKNYPDHVKEIQSVAASAKDNMGKAPDSPIIFTKATSSVIGPGASIPAWLDDTASVDYEGELAVVIGQGGRGIARDQAMQHIYGYTIINDVTSRRLQKQHQQWFIGKSLDGFCPMGPCLVTRNEVPDVTALHVQTRINGELRQDGYVRDMLFDIPTLIATLSKGMTLMIGDIIATGTPAGVGMGFQPPKFLRNSDKVAITIEPVGTLENTVE